jgi:TPR repeat protein
MYEQGIGIKKSLKKAKFWLNRLIKKGDKKAKEDLKRLQKR